MTVSDLLENNFTLTTENLHYDTYKIEIGNWIYFLNKNLTSFYSYNDGQYDSTIRHKGGLFNLQKKFLENKI